MFEAILCCFRPAVKDERVTLNDSARLLFEPCVKGKTRGATKTAMITVFAHHERLEEAKQVVEAASLKAPTAAPTASSAALKLVTSEDKPAWCTQETTTVSAPFLSDEAMWTSRMPAAIRHERLHATLHPGTSAAWGVVFISSEARKLEVFGDAVEAEPDLLVSGEDVFYDPLPVADDVPLLNNEDEIMAAKPDCDLTLNCTLKQGAKVKGPIFSVIKIATAVMWTVLSSLFWVLRCVAGMVTGAVRAVVRTGSSAVKSAVGLVSAVACAAWAVLECVFCVTSWPVVGVCKLAAILACAAWAVLRGVVYMVTWPVVAVCTLVGFIACTALVVVRGMVYMVTWPVVQVVKLAAFLVRFGFCALMWTVCAVVKAPLHLLLLVYYAVACVVRGLIRGLVALKHAVFGPRRSQCAAVVEFNSSLVELSASELCALINPHRCTFQEVW